MAQLGFSTEEDADTLSINTVAETGNGMVVRVEKRKIAIPLWAFSSRRDLPRNPNPEVAQAMLNFLIGALNNERIVQGAGMDQLIDMLNETLKVIGFPPDFKIRFTGQTPEEQQSEMMQVVEQLQQQTQEQYGGLAKEVMNNARQIKDLVTMLSGDTNPDGEGAVQDGTGQRDTNPETAQPAFNVG